MTWHTPRTETIQLQQTLSRTLDPEITKIQPERRKGTRRSFKQVMEQCYNTRNEAQRIREAEQELLRGQAIQDVEKTAYHDEGYGANPSPGESVATIDSPISDIYRADVLRDPKIRGYIHPSLRRK